MDLLPQGIELFLLCPSLALSQYMKYEFIIQNHTVIANDLLVY
jgi:hypothetical protein